MDEKGKTFDTCAAIGFASPDDLLKEAVESGDLQGVKDAVHAGANVNGAKAFQFRQACAAGLLDIAKYLREHGADIRAQKSRALSDAAENGRSRVVSWLLEEGVDPNADDRRALIRALAGDHIDTARALVRGGARVDDMLVNLFEEAVQKERHDVALFCIDNGADTDALSAEQKAFYKSLHDEQVMTREKSRNTDIRAKIRNKTRRLKR